MGRDDLYAILGKPVGEPVIINGRKATVSAIEHQDGWMVVAARVGQISARRHFTAVIRRCTIDHDHAQHHCLGSGAGVHRLAVKIKGTYK